VKFSERLDHGVSFKPKSMARSGKGYIQNPRSLQDGGVGEVLGDAGLPLGGAGGVDAGAERVDGDGDGHVDDIELVDGFHAQVGEGEDAGGLDGLGDEVGRAADGDEVDGVELADGGDGFWPALGFSDHSQEPRRGEDLAGELVHAGGGGGAGGADCLVADGQDRANVVEEAAAQVDGEGFAAVEHVGEALVRGIAAGEQRAGEQDDFAGLPCLDVVAGSRADQRPAVGFDEMDAHHPPQCWKLSKPAALLTASHPALPILDSSGSEFEGRV